MLADDGVSPVKLPECEERKEKSARKDGTSSGEGVKQHRQGKTRISEDDWQPEDAEVSNGEGREESDSDGDQEEQMNIFQEDEAVEIEGGLKIPGRLYDSLFPYQQTGLKWLWELHCQRIGGIIGDGKSQYFSLSFFWWLIGRVTFTYSLSRDGAREDSYAAGFLQLIALERHVPPVAHTLPCNNAPAMAI